MKRLEARLDNVVYRAGIGQSRDQAKQLVSHGHILVNDRRVNMPSFETKVGDVLKIKEGSMKSPYFSTLIRQWIKKYEPPKWLELDKDALIIKITGAPAFQDSGLEYKDIRSLIEFYSR